MACVLDTCCFTQVASASLSYYAPCQQKVSRKQTEMGSIEYIALEHTTVFTVMYDMQGQKLPTLKRLKLAMQVHLPASLGMQRFGRESAASKHMFTSQDSNLGQEMQAM